MRRWPHWRFDGYYKTWWDGRDKWITKNEGECPNFLVVLRWGVLPIGFYVCLAPNVRASWFKWI